MATEWSTALQHVTLDDDPVRNDQLKGRLKALFVTRNVSIDDRVALLTGSDEMVKSGILALLELAAAAAQPPAAQPGPLIVTFMKAKQTVEFQFNHTPTWEALCEAVEDTFFDMRAEDFILKTGKLRLDADTWPGFASGRKSMIVAVISIAKPFSSFPQETAFKLLGTILEYVEEDDNEFQLAVYDSSTPLPPELDECVGMKTYGDVMSFVGKELALRCLRSRHPADHVKEASRRELISPILFGAATLSGDVDVEAELAVKGTVARGSIDYVLLFKYFSIVVVEGKLYEMLEQHLGQLAAEIRAAREQYTRIFLGKRKHEDEGEFSKVPSFGILATGTVYIFYKYMPDSKRFIKCSTMTLPLKHGIKAEEAAKEALPVVRRLVHIINEQKEKMMHIKRPK